ncbi:MAG: hypothetical protein R3321_09830 [Nitrososphaeraceae archaeon]|nr:hypothetical protein [Nitrososphaeraceae archaeon]
MLQDTLKLRNKTVEIFNDEYDDQSPREWDNLGIMAFFHGRYNLGDNHDFVSPDDLLEFMKEENPISLPVYMYDHSGIGLSTDNSRYPYNCPWDSGMLGYIYVERDTIRSEYGWKNLTQDRIDKIKSYLEGEVETYNFFVQGRTYYFVATCDLCGETDSCGGFYGEDWHENGLVAHADYPCHCEEKAYNNLMIIQE